MGIVIKSIFVIIGSIVGAGFASGQEISIFFVENGFLGIIAFIVSIILIIIFIVKTIKLNPKDNQDYTVFLNEVFRGKKVVVKVVKYIGIIFLFITFLVMGIAFITLLEHTFNTSRIICAVIVSIITFLVLRGNMNGVTTANQYIVPFLIIITLIIGIRAGTAQAINIEIKTDLKTIANAIISSLLYASYNVIVMVPILLKLVKEIENKNKIKIASIIIFTVLIITGIAVYFASNIGGNYKYEFPMLVAANKMGNLWNWLYIISMFGAIFTSQICSGYSLLSTVTKNQKQYNIFLLVLCISVVVLNNFTFSKMVQLFYPVFGILGFIQIFVIILEKKRLY